MTSNVKRIAVMIIILQIKLKVQKICTRLLKLKLWILIVYIMPIENNNGGLFLGQWYICKLLRCVRRGVHIIYQCTLSNQNYEYLTNSSKWFPALFSKHKWSYYFDEILQNTLALTTLLLFGITILFHFHSS